MRKLLIMKRPGTEKDMFNIIYWFCWRGDCDVLKLIGLCYFAYAWGLVFLNREIAKFEFIKTPLGPVEKRIAESYVTNCNLPKMKKPILDPKLERLLEITWQKYGQYPGEFLLNKAKIHKPYRQADNVLRMKDMRDFYFMISKGKKA